jgi:hypothetical protein
MSDKLTDKVVELIDGAKDVAYSSGEKLITFLEEEAPNLFAEIIALGRVNSIAHIATLLFMIGIIFYLMYRAVKYLKSDSELEEAYCVASICILIVGTFLMLPLSVSLNHQLDTLVKAYAAPRVYAIEYMTKIITPADHK